MFIQIRQMLYRKQIKLVCVCVEMTLKAQSANPTRAEPDGLDETYYTDLLKMKLDNAV